MCDRMCACTCGKDVMAMLNHFCRHFISSVDMTFWNQSWDFAPSIQCTRFVEQNIVCIFIIIQHIYIWWLANSTANFSGLLNFPQIIFIFNDNNSTSYELLEISKVLDEDNHNVLDLILSVHFVCSQV